MRRNLLLSLCLLCAAACKGSPPKTSTQRAPSSSPTATKSIEARAQTLAQELLVIDGHVDLPMRLDRSRLPNGELGEDIRQKTARGDFDYVRANQGGLNVPFMSIYVEPYKARAGLARTVADRRIDIVETLVQQSPTRVALARSTRELRSNVKKGLLSLPMGIENGSALTPTSLDELNNNLRHFYDRGVRYITLAHTRDNLLSDSSGDTRHTHGGLSEMGRAAVREMNRLGIIVDVSHLSADAFWQVLHVSRKPVIASHSSCRTFTPSYRRNLSDTMIRALAAQGGIVMISFGSSFLDDEAHRDRSAFLRARKAMMRAKHIEEVSDPKVTAWEDEYKKSHTMRLATVDDIAKHIDHVVKLVGIDHVGLGSDFEGVGDSLPEGLKDVSDLPHLFAALLRRDYSKADIAKIAGENLLRVWRKVEETTPEIIERPIVFSQQRVQLTEQYRREHYGEEKAGITITPRAVVMHWTGVPTLAASVAKFDGATLATTRPKLSQHSKLNVSTHFMIDRDGAIYRLMPETWMARHTIGLNHAAIGIENVGGSQGKDDLTAAQVRSNARLIRYLARRYRSIDWLLGHHQYQKLESSALWKEKDTDYRTHKQDPGDAFVSKVAQLLERWGSRKLKRPSSKPAVAPANGR